MNMRESILKFADEFAWEPVIENEALLARKEKIIVAGMGGSSLAADLLLAFRSFSEGGNTIDPALNIMVHKNYGLPIYEVQPRKNEYLLVGISYSGNTEETLDAFEEAGKRGMARAAISKGGKLLERAREEGVAYIQLPASTRPASTRGEQGGPDTNIQPRMATGFIMKALAALLGFEALTKELIALANILKPAAFEDRGRALAERIRDGVPLIYASTRNQAIAYNWKIKFNETGRIPAFCNVFPELNHNEMNGLSSQFYTIILRDSKDDPRIKKRMEALAELYRDRGVRAEIIDFFGNTFLERVFSSLLLADWTALALAEINGVDPSEVPIVEEFKKRIA